MHLWPSTKIRDSFKFSSVKSLEKRIKEMNAEKKASADLEQKLLDAEGGSVNQKLAARCIYIEGQNSFLDACKDILVCLTCGCFCGACNDEVVYC